MMHVTFADKSFVVGDEAATTALEYAVVLARNSTADTVTLNAISSDGDEVQAILLLGAGAPFMAETVRSSMPEPQNEEAVAYMRTQMDRFTRTSNVGPTSPGDVPSEADYDDI